MAAGDEAIALLKGIDAKLAAILAELRKGAATRPSSASPAIASDRDLDGQYGNPVVKFDPRDWSGPSMKGRTLSECPAEYLEMLASAFDYFAQKAAEKDERTNSGKPKADYNRADAARCRGWAKRVREGKVQQAPMPTEEEAMSMTGWD